MRAQNQPLLVVFAGPNGAGKSTLRRITLGSLNLTYVNADDIARERFGADAAARAYEAAHIAEEERQGLFAARADFSFETVLSDPVGEKVRFLADARAAGYYVVVHFVGIASAAQSRVRVFQRVQEGGHDVPDEKIEARFHRTLANLERAIEALPVVIIFNNSNLARPFQLEAVYEKGRWIGPPARPSRAPPASS